MKIRIFFGLWSAIFKKPRVKLLYFIIYYLQLDKISKNINLTLKIVF